jgi:hypothetical protein
VRFGGVLEWRPRPTPGCSAIEEEEEEEEEEENRIQWNLYVFVCAATYTVKKSAYIFFKHLTFWLRDAPTV